ncbi:MAG: hypothetical protein NVSMB45_16750 [Ginsengibacter sp.]
MPMEVHHSHSSFHKKKFKDYLGEFFMIFLAVAAGFFAETFRESLAESKKEKEYISSLVSDLQQDTMLIGSTSKRLLLNIRGQDSLINLLNHYADNDSINLKAYNYFFNYTVSVPQVIFTDRTINQLISSGSMRLIDYKISDSIISYDFFTKGIKIQGNYYNQQFKTTFDQSTEVFDFTIASRTLKDNYTLSAPLLLTATRQSLVTTDKKVIKKYSSDLTMLELISLGYVLNLQSAKLQASRLITQLKKHYNL